MSPKIIKKPTTTKSVARQKAKTELKNSNKTFSLKSAEISRRWYILDASQATLGRLSTAVASLLMGKRKPTYTPHIDNGDFVVVVNSDNLVVTGDKLEKKIYYRHSNYPGGLKQSTLRNKMEKDSTDVIKLSVKGMLPSNKLRANRLSRLKVYNGEQHKHNAQNPETIVLKKGNN